MFHLHDAARENLNKLARSILEDFKEIEPQPPDSSARQPDLYVDATIHDEDVEWLVRRLVEATSQRVIAIDLPIGDKIHRLENYSGLEKLAARAAVRPEIRSHINSIGVEECAITWLRDALRHGVRHEFTDHFLDWLDARLEDVEVWIPVANLHVEADLKFGDIVLRPIGAALIDGWAQMLASSKTDEERLAWSQGIRERTQGHTAAVCNLRVEPRSAYAVATAKVGEAVAFLRLADRTLLHPLAKSCVHLVGRTHLDSSECWFVRPGSAPDVVGYAAKPWPVPVLLSAKVLEEFYSIFDKLGRLASVKLRSPWQEQLAEAISWYSESALTRDAGEKLLRVFTALEMLLLRDQSEALGQNISERMAFVVARSVDERLNVVTVVRECYGMRSRYVHHGRTPEDFSTLERFLLYSYRLFLRFVATHEDFETKDGVIDQLERAKFWAPAAGDEGIDE